MYEIYCWDYYQLIVEKGAFPLRFAVYYIVSN